MFLSKQKVRIKKQRIENSESNNALRNSAGDDKEVEVEAEVGNPFPRSVVAPVLSVVSQVYLETPITRTYLRMYVRIYIQG